MAQTLVDFSVSVEDLADLNRLPTVDELRPCQCPVCGHLARRPGDKLGIVGNGTYTRQVLGLCSELTSILVVVRRYLCRGCGKSLSVLPDSLLPRRWYAGTAMLLALVMSLLQGIAATKVREALGKAGTAPGWKTLDRWQRGLLAPLWSWLGAQVGSTNACAGATREERAERLRRLVRLEAVDVNSSADEIASAARALARGSAHSHHRSWQLKHSP